MFRVSLFYLKDPAYLFDVSLNAWSHAFSNMSQLSWKITIENKLDFAPDLTDFRISIKAGSPLRPAVLYIPQYYSIILLLLVRYPRPT